MDTKRKGKTLYCKVCHKKTKHHSETDRKEKPTLLANYGNLSFNSHILFSWHTEELFRRNKMKLPRWLWFEVTDKCNSRCQICNIWRKKPIPENDLLGFTRFFDILQSPLFKNVEYIINSGGEPTLVQDLRWVLMAEATALPKATLQLSSNGILAEKLLDIVKHYLALNRKLDVGLSLDGIGYNHDVYRGAKGNFEKVDWLLKELKALNNPLLNISVGSTLTEYTVKHSKALCEYAKKMDVFFMWHWFNKSAFYGNKEVPTQQHEWFQDAVLSVMSPSLYRDMWLKTLKTGKIPKFKCYALMSFCVLKCNGDIVPCLNLWNESIGNVKDADPLTIWNSAKAKDTRGRIAYCEGCLNNWAVNWSLRSYPFKYPLYLWKAKQILKEKLKLED